MLFLVADVLKYVQPVLRVGWVSTKVTSCLTSLHTRRPVNLPEHGLVARLLLSNVVMIVAPNVFSVVWHDRRVVYTLHGFDPDVSEEPGALRVTGLVCQSSRGPAVGCYVDEQSPRARFECAASVDVSVQRYRYLTMITDHGDDLVHKSVFQRDTKDTIC
jgi:hypothetical protein